MIRSKGIDKLCCAVLAVMLLVTVLFMNGEKLGLTVEQQTIGYENLLFDQSKVHTIDIVADDWEGFLETCTDEEYILVDLVIDGKSIRKVGLRAKGNTSLTQVANYGNDRYSFKIELDHYDSSKSYYGLDKFCLNNIIQDNTYMKDYLAYTLMGEMGVASPLCSYTYVTVNGEDWGLYLAVEAVEDSFLERNYGAKSGNLYKPDSMSFGGGRGNGKDFQMTDFLQQQQAQMEGSDSDDTENTNTMDAAIEAIREALEEQGIDTSGISDDISFEELGPEGLQSLLDDLGGIDLSTLMKAVNDSGIMEQFGFGGDQGGFGGDQGGFGGGMDSGMGSDDVKLKYIDDDPDSYSNIFDSAKTDITEKDEERLIQSLKDLSNNENIDEVVNVEQVIRYFVVHDFVQNGDSYTGSIIHNYYLYEDDGQLEMIPWDYNLAFGGFANGGFGGGSGMTSTVNAPIDSPTGSTDLSDRPMVAWIFENEEYTALYHEIYQEFIDTWFSNHELETLIEDTVALISPYVEKDPTAFCTYEEFQTGAETIEEFVVLRAKSVQGQLSGTIPSTYEEQQRDQSSFIDASFLNADDMGSQNADGNMGGGDMGGGDFQPGEMGDKGGKGGFGGGEAPSKPDGEMPDGEQPAMPDEGAGDPADGTESGEPAGAAEELPDGEAPAMPDGEAPSDGEIPEMPEGEAPDGFGGEQGGKPDGEVPSMPDGEAPAQPADGEQPETSDTEDNAPDADAAAPAEGETPDADAAATADGEHGGDHQMGGKDGQDGGQGGFDPGNGDGGPGGDMPAMDNMGGAPDGAAQSGLSLTSWVELAASAVILLAGLLFAKLYKRRRS